MSVVYHPIYICRSKYKVSNDWCLNMISDRLGISISFIIVSGFPWFTLTLLFTLHLVYGFGRTVQQLLPTSLAAAWSENDVWPLTSISRHSRPLRFSSSRDQPPCLVEFQILIQVFQPIQLQYGSRKYSHPKRGPRLLRDSSHPNCWCTVHTLSVRPSLLVSFSLGLHELWL